MLRPEQEELKAVRYQKAANVVGLGHFIANKIRLLHAASPTVFIIQAHKNRLQLRPIAKYGGLRRPEDGQIKSGFAIAKPNKKS